MAYREFDPNIARVTNELKAREALKKDPTTKPTPKEAKVIAKRKYNRPGMS